MKRIVVAALLSLIHFSCEGMNPQVAFVARIAIAGIPQPTTAVAAAESCANANARDEQSATTKWFVAVFSGFANAGNGYVTPPNFDGFPENRPIHANAIIRFDRVNHGHDKAHNTTCTKALGCSCLSAEQCFWDAFRRIASNPIGRVLLYRILIEIIRGTEAADALALHPAAAYNAAVRVMAHNLLVKFELKTAVGARFVTNGTFVFSNRLPAIPLVKKVHTGGANYEMCSSEEAIAHTVSAVMVHEFLHWYHFLRCHNRFSNYWISLLANGGLFQLVNVHPVSVDMYFGIAIAPGALESNSRAAWSDDYEEILTIIGRNRGIAMALPLEYIEGDDLSENAYRMSCGLPHTYGYNRYNVFLEDVNVLNYSTNVAHNCVQSIITVPPGVLPPAVPLALPPIVVAPAGMMAAPSPNTRYQEKGKFSEADLINQGIGNSFFP